MTTVFCSSGNTDHSLIVIRSEENSTDQNRTQNFWTAQEFLCENCFSIYKLSDIEKFNLKQKERIDNE